MVNQYNLYNFEASFRNYLLAENVSRITLKNYLSDFRYFAGWMSSINVKYSSLEDILSLKLLDEYKTYLIDSQAPIKTINRRLSTTRKFCSFCVSQGWIKDNPAKKLSNHQNSNQTTNRLLNLFEGYLKNENYDQLIIKSYLNNIEDFLKV